MFRAWLFSPDIASGPKSAEVALFEWDDLPSPDIAFPIVAWALRHHRESRRRGSFPPYSNPVEER